MRRGSGFRGLDVPALVSESGLSENTVKDWLRGRRACAPKTESSLRAACARLGIRVPRKEAGRSNLYALFPDIRLRVSVEERVAFIAAAEAAGEALGPWIRNLVCRTIGREPRKTRNTGSGTAEQLGILRGPKGQGASVPCEICGNPIDALTASRIRRGKQRAARCMDHKMTPGEAARRGGLTKAAKRAAS